MLAPTGELIDGRRLLAESVGFGRALRAAGLPVDMAARSTSPAPWAWSTSASAASSATPARRVFVRRRDDREVYDRVFAQFWRRRGRKLPPNRMHAASRPTPSATRRASRAPSDEPGEGRETTMSELASIGHPGRERRGRRRRDRGRDDLARRLLDERGPAPSRLRPDDGRGAARRRAVRGPAPPAPRAPPHPALRAPPARPARSPRGRCSGEPRDGGELTEWVWRRQIREPRQLVVLCDISGSMERHSRLLLRFVQALARQRTRSAPSRSCSGRASPG